MTNSMAIRSRAVSALAQRRRREPSRLPPRGRRQACQRAEDDEREYLLGRRAAKRQQPIGRTVVLSATSAEARSNTKVRLSVKIARDDCQDDQRPAEPAHRSDGLTTEPTSSPLHRAAIAARRAV